MKGGINLMKPCAVVHTWKDMEKSEELHAPKWRSSVRICVSWEVAHSVMKTAFADYLKDNIESVIDAHFNHDCASLEYAEGCKEIWTLTSDVVNSPLFGEN